jgi:hypothetical protein
MGAVEQRDAADKRRFYARFARFINPPLAADPGVGRTSVNRCESTT